MNFPENFDQALDWAVEDALRHVTDQVAVAVAGAQADLSRQDLVYARMMGFSSEYIVEAELQYAAAEYAFEQAQYGKHGDTTARVVWESETQFDGNCNDYKVIVRYVPRAFSYEVLRKSDFEIEPLILFKGVNDAIAYAMQYLYETHDESESEDLACESGM